MIRIYRGDENLHSREKSLILVKGCRDFSWFNVDLCGFKIQDTSHFEAGGLVTNCSEQRIPE